MSGGTYITTGRRLALATAGVRRYASAACRFLYLAASIAAVLLAALAAGVAVGLWFVV